MLRVWAPPGYDDAENAGRRYPVLYLNDGQNLFDPATAFAGVDWQVDEAAERLIAEQKIPPLLIVGMDNAQKERAREYLPHRALSPPLMRPRGTHYPRFVIEEVMPFVAQRYRVDRGPENTALGGSSLGAIASLYTAIARPGVFGRLLLESPSLFVSNRRLLNDSRRFRVWPERIFVGVGTRESGRPDQDTQIVDDVHRLERILQRSGLGPERLRVVVENGASHSEGAWAQRFPGALEFLFGKRP